MHLTTKFNIDDVVTFSIQSGRTLIPLQGIIKHIAIIINKHGKIEIDYRVHTSIEREYECFHIVEERLTLVPRVVDSAIIDSAESGVIVENKVLVGGFNTCTSVIDHSWKDNPDRMGGQYTDLEIRDSERWI